MSRKIIGVTVGSSLPKPNFKQTDPTKGDYIKNKPDFEGLKAQVDRIQQNAYDDTAIRELISENTSDITALEGLVGDTKVATQISNAIATKSDVGHNHDSAYDAKGAADTALTNAKSYTDAEIAEWVGDKTVSEQISTAIANKSDVGHTHDYIPVSAKGSASGVAELDKNGKVLSSQLPSYVDDVVESSSKSAFPASGETGKIYIAIDTNKTYRWSGSAYTEISSSLALGETASTAYRGDRGAAAYTHSQITSGNPHGTSKTDLGLGNVENKSSATIRGELTKTNVTDALGFTPATTNVATNSTNGLMSSTDKAALDNLGVLVGDTKVSEQITKAISEINYPVDSINGKTGAVTLTAEDVGAPTVEELNNLSSEKADVIQIKSGSVISADNCAHTPIKGLNLFGKTTQLTTTGKNLLNPSHYKVASATEQYKTMAKLVEELTFLPGVTYTLSFDTENTGCLAYFNEAFFKTHKEFTMDGKRKFHSFVYDTDQVCPDGTAIVSRGATTDGVSSGLISNIQLEINTTATAYEPYTGGAPSPSPDYPQPLVSPGDDGSVAVSVCGKNLLPKFSSIKGTGYSITAAEDGTLTLNSDGSQTASVYDGPKDKIKLPAGTYILSGSSVSSAIGNCDLCVQKTGEDGALIVIARSIGGNEETFTLEEETTLNVWTRCGARFVNNNVIVKPMIRSASITDSAYEPYKTGQTMTAQTPNGLPGIPVSSGGNYTDENGQQWICDEIDFARGKYVQRVGTYVTDDSTKWNKNGGDEYIGSKNIHVFINVADMTRDIKGTLCDSLAFASNRFGTSNEVDVNVQSNLTGQRSILFDVDKTRWADIDAWTVYVADNPLTIQYILENPIETDLTSEEIAQYSALHTNYPNTTVYNDEGAGMSLVYYTPNTAVQMVHSPADEGKILGIDEHGCVVLKEETQTTLSSMGVTATATELNYVDGVTSNIQTQLNAKVPTSRTVNGKALSANITLSASDVGADASGAANTALTNAKAYTDAEITEWVGDKTVASQISTAIANKSDTGHTHDDRYYTESEINTKLSGKSDTSHHHDTAYAAKSHGNHVPATETANNAKFLRNDNTWQTVTPANIGAAASSHGTHVSYSTTAPVMDGTASVGSATTVARSDHKHPTDTSRASASDLTNLKNLVGDTKVSTQISSSLDNYVSKKLSSDLYGTVLPAAGNVGRIFFKKV